MKAVQLLDQVESIDTYYRFGKVTRVIGLMIESRGPNAAVGDLCHIYLPNDSSTLLAEVVGFNGEHLLLMPYTAIENIAPGSLVESTGKPLMIKVGTELIGQVVDSLGRPMNDNHILRGLEDYPTMQAPPNPLLRPRISESISLGVRSIDGLLTVGMGQRMGIFAGSGVGKSTLMGMIARQSSATLNVIALIGERGREVREFIEKDLGEEGLKRSIVVVATSDQPALMRIKAAFTATAIAEFFRDRGSDVLLVMDSLTRVSMAQREIGLAVGEPPTTKGYPPSVFALMPKLLERAGTNPHGTITAFYTVLVDGGDLDEPISDTARGILDGHIVLDRSLAEKGQYPAINILKSISRVMSGIVDTDHLQAAKDFRKHLAKYEESEDLIQIGAYKPGGSIEIDEAIKYRPNIINYLMQSEDEMVTKEQSVIQLIDIFK